MSMFSLSNYPREVVPGIMAFFAKAPEFYNCFDIATTYVFCREASEFLVDRSSRKISVPANGYACLVGAWQMLSGSGLIIAVKDFHGMSMCGGPIEHVGRLKYIDGCTDTLLIGPPKIGDPCLNHLHFPKGIRQTMHTHPSVRIGIVARGSGRAISPHGEIKLHEGFPWVIRANEEHCFYTDDSEMDVIAFHPDSDTGPADENHPMVNRTIVDGVSAAQIDEIRTK